MRREQPPAGPFVALGGLAVAAFLYGWSALTLPSVVHSVLLPAFWFGCLVLACAWFTRHPHAVVVLPALAVAVWFAVLLGGA